MLSYAQRVYPFARGGGLQQTSGGVAHPGAFRAGLNTRNVNGMMLLHFAVGFHFLNPEGARTLLETGADPNV